MQMITHVISCTGGNIELVKQNVVKALDVMMNWFETNGMKINPDKFQMIFFDRHKSHYDEFVEVNDIKIVQQPCVKLLGVNIDSGLNFNCHMREICRKAGLQNKCSSSFIENTELRLKDSSFPLITQPHTNKLLFTENTFITSVKCKYTKEPEKPGH